MPTYLELCAGIGGLSLGLERAGWSPVGFVEIDDFCRRVLRKHWPDVPQWGDLTTLDPAELPRTDMVCGGIPCQPVSTAGKQKGLEDPRWLWPHAARIVRHLRPRWVLIENVCNLLSIDSGRAAQAVIGGLSELGYDSEWFVLPACAVGAPHLRKRVFIMAHARSERLEGQGELQDPPTVPGTLSPDGGWWRAEPGLERVAHGVPGRVDRLNAIGNAVVPQVAEWVGRYILSGGRQRCKIDS